MIFHCRGCGFAYDDAERNTICPHPRFLSVEDQARKDAAIALVAGGALVRFNHQPDGPSHRIVSVGWSGMVVLADRVGAFAPHLFRKAPAP